MAEPLAIYGAAVGSFAAVGVLWRIYSDVFRDKARVQLVFGKEFRPGDGDYTILSPYPEQWSETASRYPGAEVRAVVHVTNIGKRPLSILGAGLEYENAYRIAFEPGKSANLDEGQFLMFSISEESLSAAMCHYGIPTFTFAMDASSKVYRSAVGSDLLQWLTQLATSEVT